MCKSSTVVEQPKGTTVISLNFSPNPTPAITDTLRQQTTELQQPELELQTKTEDDPDGSEEDKKKDRFRWRRWRGC